MSSYHHRHRANSSLRRAIRAQTGEASYPYQRYSPMNYKARYTDSYGYYGEDEAAGEDEEEEDKGMSWTAILSPLATFAGGVTSTVITTKQNQRAQEAELAAENYRFEQQLESEERSRMAEIAAMADRATGGRGMTVLVGSVAVLSLGGLTWWLIRRKKK